MRSTADSGLAGRRPWITRREWIARSILTCAADRIRGQHWYAYFPDDVHVLAVPTDDVAVQEHQIVAADLLGAREQRDRRPRERDVLVHAVESR